MTSRPVGQEGRCSLVVRQFNGSFFTVHEIIAYNKVTRIWIYFIVVFGFGSDLDFHKSKSATLRCLSVTRKPCTFTDIKICHALSHVA